MDKNDIKILIFWVEVMNNKMTGSEKTWSHGTNSCQPSSLNVTLNLPDNSTALADKLTSSKQ